MSKRKKSALVPEDLEVICVSGVAEGVRVVLDPKVELRFGRSRKGIELADDRVSLHHACIGWTSDGWMLADLNSATGTKIGGAVLRDQEVRIQSGDQFEIGGSTFVVSEMNASWNRAARFAGIAAVGMVAIGLLGFILAPRANRKLMLPWHQPIHQGAFTAERLQLNLGFLRLRGIDPSDLSIRRVEDSDGDGTSEVWLRFSDREQVITFDSAGGWVDRGEVPMGCLDDGVVGGQMPTLSCRGVTWAVMGEKYEAVSQEGIVVWGVSSDAERTGEHAWRVNLRKKKTLAGFLAASGIDRPAHYLLCEGALTGVAAQVVLEDGRVVPLNRSCRDAVKIAGLEVDSVRALAFTATGYRALLDDLETFYSGNLDGVFRPPTADEILQDWTTSPGTVIATAFVSFDEAEHFFEPIAAEGGLQQRRTWLLKGAIPAPTSTTATLMRSGVVRLDPPGCALLEIEVSEWTCPLAQGCLPGSTFLTVRDQGCGGETTVAKLDYKGGRTVTKLGDLDLVVSTRVTGGLERRDVIQALVSWRISNESG